MALSPGGLAGYLLLGILANVAVMAAFYVYQRKLVKDGKQGINIDFSDKVHGAFRWILFVLITCCWVFSIVAIAACTFLEVTVPYAGLEVTFGMGFTQFFLPAAIANPAECQGFQSDGTGYFEGNTTAFIFAIVNCILTTLGLAGIVCIQFIMRIPEVRNKVWLGMKIGMYCSLWCAICTFYIRQIDVCDQFGCSLGAAGITQVFNVLSLIVVSILLFVTDCGEESAFDKCRTKTTVVHVPAGTIRPSHMSGGV